MFSKIRMLRGCLMMLVAGLGLMAAGTLAEAAEKPIGRILEITGKVRVLDVTKKSRPAEVFGTVYAEESLELEADASVVISFRVSRKLERISKVSKATLKETGVEPREAATSLELKNPQAMKLVGNSLKSLEKGVGGVTLTRSAGPAAPLPAVSPIVGCTVLTANPTFNWPTRENAKSYELILKGPKLKKKPWRTDKMAPPVKYDGDTELENDKEYLWEVFVTLNDDKVLPICNGSFHIGSDETYEAAKDLEALNNETEPPLVALAAIRLEELGLYEDAIRQYERLLELSPRRAEFPAALSELYDKAGKTTKAAESRKLAEKLGYVFAKEKSTKEAPASNE